MQFAPKTLIAVAVISICPIRKNFVARRRPHGEETVRALIPDPLPPVPLCSSTDASGPRWKRRASPWTAGDDWNLAARFPAPSGQTPNHG